MKKLIVITLVGLFIGLSGAAGIVITREKQARAVAAALAADSAAAASDSLHAETAAHAGAPDSLGVAHAAGDPGTVTGADSSLLAAANGAAQENRTAAGAEVASPGASPTAVAPPADSVRAVVLAAGGPAGPDEQRLARIFAAMRPAEAARVLERMTDPEVRLLLSHLKERQAAAILSSIAPERAAVISSAVIRIERRTP